MKTHNISEEKIAKFRRKIFEWFKHNKRNFPWRDGKRSAYEILVAEILLQKTKAENIVDVYLDFVKRFPNPEKLSKAKFSELERLLKPLGLYRNRSRNLIKLGKELVKTKGKGDLKELPGVGPYIANAFLLTVFNKRLPVVDTNVRRLYERVFSVKSKPDPRRDKSIWGFAERVLPKKRYREFTWGILDFSAIICKKKNPKCNLCPLKSICDYYEKHTS